MRFLKKTTNRVERLIKSFMVNNYHKTLLKGMLNSSRINNLQKADKEILPLILNQYKFLK